MSRAYWVTGLNFDYEIHEGNEPPSESWGSVEGPFTRLEEAKKYARELIANDRAHIQTELASINKLRASDFK